MQPSLTRAGVSLRELLADEVRGVPTSDVRAASCTCDSRTVRAGDVFVAVADADTDGHDEAGAAAERGAAAVVCERPLPVFNIPQFVVSDSRSVYGRLCQALVGYPSQQLKLIGVTGSSGKTTFARLLTAIFREAGAQSGTLDSFGYWDGLEDRPALEAPLSPPVFARSLAEMAASGVTHAVAELSSRELSQGVLAGVTLDAACVTQIGRDHLDWHNSLTNYRRAKRRILDHLSVEGVAILNADDPTCVEMLSDLDRPALTFGMKKPAEISAQIVEQQINEQTFVLSAGDESVGVRTEIIGEHHVYNCLAAAAMALAYGVPLTNVARGLEAVDRLPGRMERIMCGQDFAVFVDAAKSPDVLRACLRAARHATTGRLICVFGAGEEERHDRPTLGRVAGAMADLAVITSATPNGEDAGSICLQVRSGFANANRPQVVLDRTAAIAQAMQLARAGDTVVIAGMGERNYEIFDADGLPVNDAEIVRQALRGTLTPTRPPKLAA